MQTKKLLLLPLLTMCSLLIILTPNKVFTQVLNSPEFTSIKVSGLANVFIQKGESCTFIVEGNTEDTSKLKTLIENGKLIISSKGDIKNENKLKITVTIKELKSIELGGASNVKSIGELESEALRIESAGAGNANLTIKVKKLATEVSGAGNLHLTGTATSMQSKISGAGDLKAYSLLCDSVSAIVSGSGSAKVSASKFLNADVSGAGNVIYKGDPTERNVSISGAGSVRQAEGNTEFEINESLKMNRHDGDTTRLKLGDKRIMIYGDEDKDTTTKVDQVKSIWSGIELGVNGYVTPSGSSDFPVKYNFLELNYKKSLCINLNFWEQNFKLYKTYVALTTGGGLEFNRYFFDNNTTLQPLNDSVSGFVSGVDFTKNCLKASYVTVPLLIEFNSNVKEKKSFHLAAGFVGGYNLTTKLKQVYELNNKTYKNKVKDDFNMNPFKLAATVRAGYGRFNVFATYGLTSFFQKKANAPDLTAFTVGVTLLHFD